MQLLPQQQQAGIAPPSQRLQGRLGDAPKPAAVTGAPLLAPQDMAEQLRLREERQEAERARQRAKEEQEKKKAEVSLPLPYASYVRNTPTPCIS